MRSRTTGTAAGRTSAAFGCQADASGSASPADPAGKAVGPNAGDDLGQRVQVLGGLGLDHHHRASAADSMAARSSSRASAGTTTDPGTSSAITEVFTGVTGSAPAA